MEMQSTSMQVAQAPTRDFQHYVNIVRKRWRIITLLVCIFTAFTFVWTIRQPKIYEATCSVVIESSAPQVLEGVKDVIEMGQGAWMYREFFMTQLRIIRSREIAERVIDRLGLEHDPTFSRTSDGKQLTHDEILERFSKELRVSGVKDSRIANIMVMDPNAERAARIANALADTYMERNLDYKLDGARSAGSWLGEQTVALRKRLEDSELELYKFKKERNLLDVGLDDRLGMTRQNLQALNQKLADIRARRIEIESIRKLVQAAKDDILEKESLPEIRDNPVVQKLRENYLDLSKIKADLDSHYGEKHPKVETVQKQLEAIHRDYRRELDQVLKAFDKRYQALLDTESGLSKWMHQEKQQALELAKVEVEYRPMARDAENNAKVFGQISQRQKEIDLTGLLRANNVRTLDRAKASRLPASPRVFLNLSVGVVVGIFLGLLVAFIIEALDNTVKTPEAAEALVGAPLLGMLPMLSQSKQRSVENAPERDLTVFKDPTSLAAESCRSIRTNLMFLSAQKEVRVFVVTSPGPQDGKTTTAISLAITLAQGAAKVLLIDADMRKPRIHKSFGLKGDRGLSTVMMGDTSLDKEICHTEVPNLDFLPCGPTPPNPAELIHTDRFREILAQCRQKYDRVVVDTPPTAPVTDPAALGGLTDGVVLVLRAGHTTREAVIHARRRLTDGGARVLGLIMNRTDRKGGTYGYGYGYYEPYRYYRSA